MTNVVAPQALLVDFGGVLFSSVRRPNWLETVADEITACLVRAKCDVPPREVIERDIEVAKLAEKSWKTAASRTFAPAELEEAMFWGEFLAADWSAPAKKALVAASTTLSQAFVGAISDYVLRPGIHELLDEADRRDIPIGIVSNTRSGIAFRNLLRRESIEDRFAIQVYSDEVEIRKPNPEMLLLAARGLGVAPEYCWYAGDNYDRDVMCAQRAGIGAAILIQDRKTEEPPYARQCVPDINVATPLELAHILAAGEFSEAIPTSVAPVAPVATEAPTKKAKKKAGFTRPAALLLDHGGVIVTSIKNPEGQTKFINLVVDYLVKSGWKEFDADRITRDIENARKHHNDNKDPATASIAETSHLEFWRDLVAKDWPEHPKAAVAARSTDLMIRHVASKSTRSLRPGMLELMRRCRDNNIPIGIVSNTLCGAVPRSLSHAFGTAEYLGVEIYSDEFGFRKPDPTIIDAAVSALGVPVEDCWFVGDKPHRDIECARRAGIGTAVLMLATKSKRDIEADLIVNDPSDLLRHLDAALS